MNGDREAILGRVEEALRIPAPRHHETMPAPVATNVTTPFREWLPPVGDSPATRIETFARLSEMLRTEFKQCEASASAAHHIATLASGGGGKTLGRRRGSRRVAVA